MLKYLIETDISLDAVFLKVVSKYRLKNRIIRKYLQLKTAAKVVEFIRIQRQSRNTKM